jgi:hypothetical protein
MPRTRPEVSTWRLSERNLHKHKRCKYRGCIRRLMRGKADRMLKLRSAGRAGPHVPNTTIRQVRRPFGCDHIRTTVRTRMDRYSDHSLLKSEGEWL